MEYQSKIKQLIKTSKKVILSCCLENGAIVAANPIKYEYPNSTPNYFYIWPADAAHVCIACDYLGLHKIPENFFEWFEKKAEGIEKGWVFQRYTVNGIAEGFMISELYSKHLQKILKKYQHPITMWGENGKYNGFKVQIQPDNYGYLLWALEEHSRYNSETSRKYGRIIKNIANGIVNIWSNKFGFKLLYHGRWEEKIGYPDIYLTHSLAMCYKGLNSAINLIGKKGRWEEIAKKMKELLLQSYNEKLEIYQAVFGPKYKRRKYEKLYSTLLKGGGFDSRFDSLVFSLIWPSKVLETNERTKKFIEKLVEKIKIFQYGLGRYPGDTYDGIFVNGSSNRMGGNAWPIIHFWASLVLYKLGEKEKAVKYFNWILKKIKNSSYLLPEQISYSGKSRGPNPLAWSHAMFILASKELGYL